MSNPHDLNPFTDSGRRHGSASVEYVVMPCCGTTRMLHSDAGPGVVRRVCTKCEVVWGVTHLGEGKFKFERWHNKMKRVEQRPKEVVK